MAKVKRDPALNEYRDPFLDATNALFEYNECPPRDKCDGTACDGPCFKTCPERRSIHYVTLETSLGLAARFRYADKVHYIDEDFLYNTFGGDRLHQCAPPVNFTHLWLLSGSNDKTDRAC